MTAIETLREMLAAEEAKGEALAASTPKVLDGHSDGKRVRYVRHETTATTLRAVLALLEGGAA